jgi:hypothetical protein
MRGSLRFSLMAQEESFFNSLAVRFISLPLEREQIIRDLRLIHRFYISDPQVGQEETHIP